LLALALGGLAAACGFKGTLGLEGQALTDDANDSTETIALSSAISALPSLAIDGTEATLSEEVAAQAKLTALFPSGCLTVTQPGNVVTSSFHACSGPFGAFEIDGDEVATFSPGDLPESLLVDMHSENLTVNGAAITHGATVRVTFGSDGGKEIDWQGSYEGKTADGKKISHTSELAVVASPDGCVGVDGSTDTNIGIRGLHLDFDGVERCGPWGTCPDGTITATRKLTGTRVTLTFDGTADGVAKGALGGELDFKLKCMPATEPAT
jgi:hypothetical protein